MEDKTQNLKLCLEDLCASIVDLDLYCKQVEPESTQYWCVLLFLLVPCLHTRANLFLVNIGNQNSRAKSGRK